MAPLFTTMTELVSMPAEELPLAKVDVPLLTVVVPLYVSMAERVRVPVPTLVRPPAPESEPESVMLLPWVSIIGVPVKVMGSAEDQLAERQGAAADRRCGERAASVQSACTEVHPPADRFRARRFHRQKLDPIQIGTAAGDVEVAATAIGQIGPVVGHVEHAAGERVRARLAAVLADHQRASRTRFGDRQRAACLLHVARRSAGQRAEFQSPAIVTACRARR